MVDQPRQQPPTQPPQQPQPRPGQPPPQQQPRPAPPASQPQGKTGKDAEEEVWDPHQINPAEGSINEPLPDQEATHAAADAAKANPPHRVVDRKNEPEKK